MTTISEVGPGSFAEYEGIRIVIPGLLTYGVAVATFKTVAPDEEAGLLENPLTGIVAALAVGLLLYFIDIPARSAAYNINQPTDYLKEKFSDLHTGELLTAYLLLLNTRMPTNTRNRALYMGSMYRIGTEMILAVGIGSSVVVGAALLNDGPPQGSADLQNHRFAAAFLVLVFLSSLWASQAYGPKKLLPRIKNFWICFWTWSILFYVSGLVLVTAPVLAAHFKILTIVQHRFLGAAGLALSISYWAWRYIRGRTYGEKANRRRMPLDSAFAGFLFLLPLVLALTLYSPGENNVLSTIGLLIGWISAIGLVIAMVIIRGHERKLHGVYRGQTRWLKDNVEEVSRFLRGVPHPVKVESQPLNVDVALAEVKLKRCRRRER